MTSRIPRQALPLLAAAGLLLPAIIVLAVWTSAQFGQRRADVERDALDAARAMVMLANAEADANSRVLSLLAASRAATESSTEPLRRLVALARARNPAWNGVVLRDRASGRVLFAAGADSDEQPLRALPNRLPENLGSEGVFKEGRYCPCVVFHQPVVGAPERVISLYMSPHVYQQIMDGQVAEGLFGGLVDGDGRFLGRSADYENRVGTPGTIYVRRAVRAGGEGFYRGKTYEGLENITAYTVSPLTGWSGHVAVDRSAIDNPRGMANAAVIVALIAALVLAAGLLFYAVNEMRGRQRDERQLVAMQKAEAISRFTGTVVHDFRNILAAIESGIRLVERKANDPATTAYAQEMREAVERGKRLVNQLLSFARGDGAEVAQVDLRKLLENCDSLIARSLGDGVAFEWSVADDARYARANADQLELALLNLAINARDAMDDRGRFAIAATRQGDTVAVAASDSGPGVPPALRERIFEAFYSTKGDGKGTGLGLAQVDGAARQAGGRVELSEAPGGGARFVIYRPREE